MLVTQSASVHRSLHHFLSIRLRWAFFLWSVPFIILLLICAYGLIIIMFLLLIKDCIVNGLLSWTSFWTFQNSLAARLLLQLWIVHQQLLLLCQVTGLTIKISTNESSSTSRNLHKILSHLFFGCFCNDGFLLADCRIYLMLLLLLVVLIDDDTFLVSLSRLLSHLDCVSLRTMSTFRTTCMDLFTSLLSHAGSHESLRIWNGSSLLVAPTPSWKSCHTLVLKLLGQMLNRLVVIRGSLEFLVLISIPSHLRISIKQGSSVGEHTACG